MSNQYYTAKQRADKCVLPLDLAVYQTTKRERGLVHFICGKYGLNYNTVSAQINPNNDSHTLSPDIIEYVLTHAENKTLIMDAMCCAHGNAGWFELPTADDGEMIDDIVELGQKFVDMNSTTLAAIADKRITGDEYKAMQKVGLALIGQIQKILATAQTVMAGEK